MEMPKHLAAALTACFVTTGLLICSAVQARADLKTLSLEPGFSTSPEVIQGKSGGLRETADCGFVKAADAPDAVITLTQPFTTLRASVQAAGDVTMLIEGPNGRVCSDDVNGLMPEVTGSAPIGTYRIWIGDYVGQPESGFTYRLTLSEDSEG
ncbi:MAG: hypothetical protein MUF49_11690 [Oculatellaceae cyanobacterium Prado106]|jgi:hypothetical protein|nr:hypothetical protein [Oculatellaceae cyanobacterium Prado106]